MQVVDECYRVVQSWVPFFELLISYCLRRDYSAFEEEATQTMAQKAPELGILYVSGKTAKAEFGAFSLLSFSTSLHDSKKNSH